MEEEEEEERGGWEVEDSGGTGGTVLRWKPANGRMSGRGMCVEGTVPSLPQGSKEATTHHRGKRVHWPAPSQRPVAGPWPGPGLLFSRVGRGHPPCTFPQDCPSFPASHVAAFSHCNAHYHIALGSCAKQYVPNAVGVRTSGGSRGHM